MSEYTSVAEALNKIRSIIEDLQSNVKPAEITPDMLSALRKQGFVEGSIDWYNGLESLMSKGNSKVKGEAQDFFYYKWTPILKQKLNTLFNITDTVDLASEAIDQLNDFLNNPRNKDPFTTGNYNLAICLCIQMTRKGDYAFIENFLKTVYDAFFHWLGGGSVGYVYKRGQERINAAFLERIPVGVDQSKIVPVEENGTVTLEHKGNYRRGRINSLDDLLDIRGHNIIIESGFYTSLRKLFGYNVVLNTDAYGVNDLEQAISIAKTNKKTDVESAYKFLHLANEIVTDDEFVDMNKEVFSSESQDRVKLAAGKFPEIGRQVNSEEGYYYDLMIAIGRATHLDLSKGISDTNGEQIAQEFRTFYLSMFVVDSYIPFEDHQKKGIRSGETFGAAPNYKREASEKLQNKLTEAAGGIYAKPLRAFAVKLGLNWSSQFLDYFDNLLSFANRRKASQIDAEESNAGKVKPDTMESSYLTLFSYYLLYIVGSLDSQLGGDYSLKNIFQHLQKDDYIVEELMLAILYVEGRAYSPAKTNKNLVYTYPERKDFLNVDIDALKTAAANGKDVDDPEVVTAIRNAESRKINEVSIMDTVWDTFIKECKAKFSQEDYNVDSLENFYLTYKGLLEDGNTKAAKALSELLTKVVQSLIIAEKEPLPI